MNHIQEQGSFSFGNFVWFMAKVVDNKDAKKMGRVKIRIYGYHSDDIEDKNLPWASVMQPITSAALGGIGRSPTGLIKDSTVFGFFMDGDLAQIPVVIGALGGIPTDAGKTPNESDTNRLARNENIGSTIVQKKRNDIDTAATAGNGSWTEKSTAYAAQYPFNHVHETENGIVVQLDDTKGSQRVDIWHPSGSFIEIHPDGTIVQKCKGENYEIISKDDKVLVKGNSNLTVIGNANILVNGNAVTEIDGNENRIIKGSSTTEVFGNYTVTCHSNIKTHADNLSVHTAREIYLN